MDQVNVSTLLSILSAVVSIIAIINFWKTSKKENEQSGSKAGALQSDLAYIKNLLNDVKAEVKGINERIEENTERIAKVEESVRQAHKRLTQLENKYYKGGEH